jgi:hypothetical protein
MKSNIIELKRFTTMVGFVVTLTYVLVAPGSSTADMYGGSAHGNVSYGVNLSTATCENWPGGICTTGSCAHCHDTFDPDICSEDIYGLMLFASNDSPGSQTDNFCFQCHKGSGSVQVGGLVNYTYSKNFGGGAVTFTNIYDAFNPLTGVTPSSHNLADIQNFIAGHHDFTTETNACLACHHNHLAQRNYPVIPTAAGGVKTAIRRPTHNDVDPGNLWGDENASTSGYYELTSEVIAAHGLLYQAPYYETGSTYEPAGDTTSDGSNLPNIITFCLDCHSHSNVYSTERGRNLRVIDWTATQHGKSHQGGTAVGATIAPYTDHNYDYILVCTDCHEPHGSENEWLLRTTINGKDNIIVTGDGEWSAVCEACHTFSTYHYGQVRTCYGDGVWNCHFHGAGGGQF